MVRSHGPRSTFGKLLSGETCDDEEGCAGVVYALGKCYTHYTRLKKRRRRERRRRNRGDTANER